jgi:hypothetical protein
LSDMKSTLSEASCFLALFAWNIFFHPFTLHLCFYLPASCLF